MKIAVTTPCKGLGRAVLFCAALTTLGVLEGCSRSHANPCALISPDMGAILIGTPAVTREAWTVDYEAPAIGGRPVAGWSSELGYRLVHACSIEAVDAVARDQGKATTLFFVEYSDEARANSVYDAVRQDSDGKTLTVPKAEAFTTSDGESDDALSVWIFKDRVSVDFSIGTADIAAAQRFASKLARRL